MDPYSDENFMPAPKRRQPSASLGLFPPNFCLLRGLPPSPLNPGSIANLHKKTRDIMPEWIEGLKLRCATNLDVHKTLCMEWLMGNSTPTGFRFGGMICRKDNDNITSTPAIFGDTNPSTLATNFHLLHYPLPRIKLAANIQTGPFPYKADLGESTAMAEYLGKSSTISLTVYNPKRAAGRMTIGFLHSFNNNFCAGAELLTEWMRDRTLQYSLALAARYSMKRHSMAATISKDALDLSVWHQPCDLLQLGASLILNMNESKALGSFCYQLEMDNSVIKGMVDSECTVGCTYSRQLKNLASSFGFSVLFSIPTNKFYCGLKFELNSNLQ